MLKNRNKIVHCLFFIFIGVFFLIVLKGLTTIQPGDENVYYYMGKLISDGNTPYRDFFYAHPPLYIYLIAIVYKIFGFNIAILKSIPLISTLASAFFIFKIAKEKFDDIHALISALLFLFSYTIMFNSVFSFGVDVATLFLVIGIYFLINKKNYLLSGIFFGLAGITRLLTLIPIFTIFVIFLLYNKRKFLKLIFGFFIVFFLVNGIFLLLFKNDYLVPVFKFHLLKSFVSGESFREYADIIKLNWILFSFSFLFILVREKKPVSIFAVVSVVYLLFLTTLKKIFGFYFIVVFPLLAIIGGYSIVSLARNINLHKKWKIIIFIILLSIFSWDLVSNVFFLEKIGFTGFERGKELIDFVNSRSNKDTLLFGDASVVPLIALSTNRSIAFNLIDTNNQVFISEVINLKNILSNLKGKKVIFIIRSTEGISYFSEVKSFLNANCDFLSQFYNKLEGSYLVYMCS